MGNIVEGCGVGDLVLIEVQKQRRATGAVDNALQVDASPAKLVLDAHDWKLYEYELDDVVMDESVVYPNIIEFEQLPVTLNVPSALDPVK